MNRPVAYLETSFVSYLTGWVSRDERVAVQQAATVRWWEEEGPKWHCVVSDAVFDEVQDGDSDAAGLLEGVDVLKPTEEAILLAETLLAVNAMPETAREDAMHVALAAACGAELLLTWKRKTIANCLKLPKIYVTLQNAGHRCPVIATPGQLLAEKEPPDEIMQEVYRAREHLWNLGGGTMRGVCEYLMECGRRSQARGVKWIESKEEREAIGIEVRERMVREAASRRGGEEKVS